MAGGGTSTGRAAEHETRETAPTMLAARQLSTVNYIPTRGISCVLLSHGAREQGGLPWSLARARGLAHFSLGLDCVRR